MEALLAEWGTEILFGLISAAVMGYAKWHGQKLRKEVEEVGYESFIIEDDIGGRYSIVTPAHLFPLAFNVDIKKFIEGYYNGRQYMEDAFIQRLNFTIKTD